MTLYVVNAEAVKVSYREKTDGLSNIMKTVQHVKLELHDITFMLVVNTRGGRDGGNMTVISKNRLADLKSRLKLL